MTSLVSGSARPPGNIPSKSAYGLGALGILTGVVPFLVMQSLVPILENGLDIWMGSWLPAIGASAIASGIMAIGLHRRKPWYIGFIFWFGCVLLTAFMSGFCFGLACLAGLIPESSPDLRFIHYVNIVLWLMTSPLAWLLLRTLRLHYWQPWTGVSDWEVLDDCAAEVPRTLIMMLANRKQAPRSPPSR